MAARSKFTAARRNAIIEALGRGHPLRTAAAMAGVDRSTVYDWLERGEKAGPDSAYRRFYEDVERAQATVVDTALAHIRDAMPDDWRAAMTYLERRFPDEFTKRERREISGPKDGPVEVVVQWPGAAPPGG